MSDDVGPFYEHASTIATIEMGARMYSASLGRFLALDPVTVLALGIVIWRPGIFDRGWVVSSDPLQEY